MLEAGLLQSIAMAPPPPAPPVPPPAPASQVMLAALAFGSLVALAAGATILAWRFGALGGGGAGGIRGPVRVAGRTKPVAALGIALLVALAVTPLPALVLAAMRGGIEAEDLVGPLALVLNLSAFLLAAGAAVVALAVHNRFASPEDKVSLGLAPRLAPSGLVRGLGWLGLVLPWMLLAAIALSLVRSLLGYDANATHELLEQMQSGRRDRDATLVVLAVFTAVVVAPLAEEILFRGVIQTGLAGLFCRVTGRGEPPAAPPPPPPEAHGFALADDLYVPPDAVVAEPVAVGPTSGQRWAAILITSGGFALLHPAWSIPLILLLAIAMGWLYERSGNLWVPMVVHLGFNAFNTALALAIA